MSSVNVDRAGEDYWSRLWSRSDLPRAVDPRDRNVRNRVRRQFDAFFRAHFVTPADAGKRLLEVGCARSPWLGYFAREHSLRVTGLDYSALGCDQARALLARDGVDGEIVHGDLFDPPDACLGQFDFVMSIGVVEHFEDTAGCLRALGRFLQPGGRIYTVIPNFAGSMGALQRRLDRRFFDMHVPLNEPALRRAHEAAGFRVLHGGYFLASNFGVLNHSTIPPGTAGARVRATVRAACVGVSAAVWLVEDLTGVDWPATSRFAPYVHCVGDLAATATAEP